MKLSGKPLQVHLKKEIELFINNGLKKELENFDPTDTFNKMHSLLRSIEEFINICAFGVDVSDFEKLQIMPLRQWNSFYNNIIDKMLIPSFGKDASNRFKRMVLESHLILNEFGITGHDFGFRTILEATAFYQSRRRHLITLFYVLPMYCKGKAKITEPDLLRVVIHLSDFSVINITTLHRQLLLTYIFSDFEVIVKNGTLQGNYQFDFLEDLFTEPERISIVDPIMKEAFESVSKEFVPMLKNRIFSVSELDNELTLISSYFIFFKHNDSVFDNLKIILKDLVNFSKDDYFISVPKKKFEIILEKVPVAERVEIQKLLTLTSEDFVLNSNSYHPFIELGGNYKSNVNLILRFVYHYKNVSLNKNKRFQIKSGFSFEDKVKDELYRMGFKILGVRRIERKEFDVVTVKDGTINNFQCKNNFVDITLLEIAPLAFARKNSNLIRYFLEALKKEKSRQHLIVDKYGIEKINHFVISRFPVLTHEPNIISFKDLRRGLVNF